MASTMISPNRYQGAQRKALYKSRGVSPTFKEVLRDRCHSRIKAQRSFRFEQFRNKNSNDELRKTLSNILHEEVDVLMSESENIVEMNKQENSCVDVNFSCLEDKDRWIIEEYEKVLAEEESYYDFDWDKEVICPLCQKAVLKHEITNGINCVKCREQFPTVPSLEFLKHRIDEALKEHLHGCQDEPQFALVNDGRSNNLILICHSCGLFSVAVESTNTMS